MKYGTESITRVHQYDSSDQSNKISYCNQFIFNVHTLHTYVFKNIEIN